MTVPFMGHIDQNGLLITKGSRETPNFLYCTNGARNDSKISSYRRKYLVTCLLI